MYNLTDIPGISLDDFFAGDKIGTGLSYFYRESICNVKFREHFDLVFFPEDVSAGKDIGDRARQEAFLSDIVKVNRMIGFELSDWGLASVPLYSINMTLEKSWGTSYYDIKRFLAEGERSGTLKELIGEMYRRPDPYPGILVTVELMRELDSGMMKAYIDSLVTYVRFVYENADLDYCTANHYNIRNWTDSLEAMKAEDFFVTHRPENWPKVPKKREEYLIPPFRLWEWVDKVMTGIGLAGAALVFVLFLAAELPVAGAIVSAVLFLLWILLSFSQSGVDGSSGSFGYSHYRSGGEFHSASFDSDMTKNYYGMHGEFDINDESRRVSEDMQQFHNSHPDADLTDHYYWDDVLDAETDGYL